MKLSSSQDNIKCYCIDINPVFFVAKKKIYNEWMEVDCYFQLTLRFLRIFTIFLLSSFVLETVLLCITAWPKTQDSPSCNSQVMRLMWVLSGTLISLF